MNSSKLHRITSAITLLSIALISEAHAGTTAEELRQLLSYSSSAEEGDANSQYNLGLCYERGIGVPIDYAEAIEWYRMSAEQGNANGQASLGGCYYFGHGTSKNEVEALAYYILASRSMPEAKRPVASLSQKLPQEALQRSAQRAKEIQLEIDSIKSKRNLILKSRNTHKEEADFIRFRAEAKGDAEAEYNLATCYRDGLGVAKNAVEAFNWYRKSADKDFLLAQFMLGYCYRYEIGVNQDLDEAVNWFRKAAKQGSSHAQESLGWCYMRGEGVRKDESEAASWFLKAANNGSLSAQARMGHHYKEGIGVSIDSYEAIKWYRQAAAAGLAEAQVYLGYCYAEGILGLPKDNLEALRWYRKAADQGDSEGLESLAICYSLGRGVTQSIIEAYAYYTIAMNMTAETERKSALKEHRTLAMAGMGMLSSRAAIIRAGQKRAREIEAEIATKLAGK